MRWFIPRKWLLATAAGAALAGAVYVVAGQWAGLLKETGLDKGNGTTEVRPPYYQPKLVKPRPEPRRQQEPTLRERLDETPSLVRALDLVEPEFADTYNETSPGAAGLAYWAATHLRWADFHDRPGTTYGKVMKDSEAERGKRMCWHGRIAEIRVDRGSGHAVYLGGLIATGRVVRFAAVGDTGELVQGNTAKLCGIVTGRQSYANAGGGTTHAVHLVGMFDLPANRDAG